MSSHAGAFLVASHGMSDPNFQSTVVLVLEHDQCGAFGLIVNRIAAMPPGLPLPLFSGGPCSSDGLFLLHAVEEWANGDELVSPGLEVAPGVWLGDAECLRRACEAESDETYRVRVFSGYAGWGPGQLERELANGDWGVQPAAAELLFECDHEEIWDLLAPPRVPHPSVN